MHRFMSRRHTISLPFFVMVSIGKSWPDQYWIPLNMTRAISEPCLAIVSRMSSSRRLYSPSRADISIRVESTSSP
jgi:hypothetical protein